MAIQMTAATSGTSGSLHTNYARIGHAAQELFPKLLQELMTRKVPHASLHSYVSSNGYLSHTLRADEWSMIHNARTHGYVNFDISLIYKLIRNLQTVPPPTKGWFKGNPGPTEMTVGDDIERIRQTRNKILHRGNAKVSDTELKDYFDSFKDIARRLEQYLGKPKDEFVKLFTDLETCSMDENTEKMYIERLQVLGEREIELSEQIEKIEKKCGDVQHNVSTLQNSTDKVQENVGKVENKVEQINENVEKAQNTVDKVQENVVKMQEDIHAVQGNVVKVQGKVDQVHEKVEKMDYPDYLKKTVEVWIEENKSFVTTDAIKDILETLDKGHVFCVTGNSGIGKSASIQHVALTLQNKQEYTIFPCTHPMDIEKYYKEGYKQVFVFNDVCGKYTLLQDYVEEWIRQTELINNVISSGNIKILATCRSQVFVESQFQRISLLTKNHCDLSSDKYTLKDDIKLQIAKKYLTEDDVERIKSKINKYELLPLMFPMYKKLKNQHGNTDPLTFFKNPFKIFTEEIDKLKESKDKEKFCALFCLVVNNGFIDEAAFEADEKEEVCKKREQMFEACGISRGTPHSHIREQLESLIGFLVKKVIKNKNSTTYTAIHDKMFDFLCFYFGQNLQSAFIKYVDTKEFVHRTQLKSIENTGKEFVIFIDKKNERQYMEKIINDLSHGRIDMDKVFWNYQMGYKVYRLKFFQCLKDSEVEILKKIISLKNGHGQGPLFFACQIAHSRSLSFYNNIDHVDDEYELSQDRYKFVELFLDNGADVNENHYYSPLGMACELGDILLVRLLLERGADVNSENIHCYQTPLLKACQSYVDGQSPDKYEIIELLLEKGASINTLNKRGESALSIACLGGNSALIRFLIERGADLNPDYIHSYSYQTPLVNACQSYVDGQSPDKYKIIELLLEKGANINTVTDEGKSALSIACWGGNTTLIRLLIERGVEVNVPLDDFDKDCDAPITAVCSSDAVSEDKCNIIQLLLDKGADINASVRDIVSPLQMACDKGDITLIRFLIERGGEADPDNGYWAEAAEIPLLCSSDAMPEDKYDIIQLLLDKGADINAYFENIGSALEVAWGKRDITLIRFLIEKGADVDLDDLSTIEFHKYREDLSPNENRIIELLIDKAVTVNPDDEYDEKCPLITACEWGNISLVSLILDKGANVNHNGKDGFSPLAVACQEGNLTLVRLLLNNGANVNQNEEDGFSPLTVACQEGNLTLVRLLLDNGADANPECRGLEDTPLTAPFRFDSLFSSYEKTPITAACKCSSIYKDKTLQDIFKIIELLLEKGVNINTVDRWGNYALGTACDSRYDQEFKIELVKFLIEKGADVNLDNQNVNQKRCSPLTIACRRSDIQLVRYLIAKGANVNAVDTDGHSPLTNACSTGNIDFIRFLIEAGALVNPENNLLKKLPITAVPKSTCYTDSSPQQIIELLIEKGVDLNMADKSGNYSLTMACAIGDISLIRNLIDRGANINPHNDDPQPTPLNIAIENYMSRKCRCDSIIKFLLEKGANVNSIDSNGNYPLTLACKSAGFRYNECFSDGYRIVELLLEKGAYVNIINKDRTTPLIIACDTGNTDLIRFLIQKGANTNHLTGSVNKTPLTAAINHHRERYEIVELLLDTGANINTVDDNGHSPLTSACHNVDKQLVEFLIEKGSDVNPEVDSFNKTAITAVCTYMGDRRLTNDRYKIIDLLLSKGANINAVDRWGDYSLTIACDMADLELVEFLINKGADVNPDTNNVNMTPITAACYSYTEQMSKTQYKIVELLLQKGANINDVGRKGDYPLTIACRRFDIKLVRFLIEKGADVISDNDRLTRTPITVVCEGYSDETYQNRCKLINLLLEKGANVNTVDNSGDYPLTIACRLRFMYLVRFLIEKGADVNTDTNMIGKSPITEACKSDGGKPYKIRQKIIELLVEKGASVNTVDNSDNYPLQLACDRGDNTLVKFLIERGAEVNPNNNSLKQTPLTAAIMHYISMKNEKAIKIIKFLLEKGANINAVDRNGKSPFSVAYNSCNANLTLFLYQKGANVNAEYQSWIDTFLRDNNVKCFNDLNPCQMKDLSRLLERELRRNSIKYIEDTSHGEKQKRKRNEDNESEIPAKRIKENS